MPKYPEGSKSPSGKQVVRGGKWVDVEEANAQMAPEDRRRKEFMAESKVAANPYEEPSAFGRGLGEAIQAGTMMAAGGGALGAAARGLPGVLGGAARFAVANPAATGAVVGAAPSLMRGHPGEAVVEGALGAAGVKGTGALLERALGGKGGALLLKFLTERLGKNVPKIAMSAAEAAAPAATPAAMAATGAQAFAPGSHEALILELKDMGSTAEGRKQVLEYLKTQAPEFAKEVRELLGTATRHRPWIGGRP